MDQVKKHKKHKKHKSERKSKYDERPPPSLKLILKVSGTPEYGSSDSPYQINMAEHQTNREHSEKHKKSKKKKKKKDREKKHKHHKKDRHKRDSSLDESTMMLDDDDTAQMYYASMSTSSAVSAQPVTKPMIPLSINTQNEQKVFHNMQNVPMISPNPVSLDAPSNDLSPMTPPPSASVSDSGREPRTCVLKLKQSRSPLAKLLENILKALEKRDPHQFFAWPVTDDIAPGYSAIITKPMDFSTIRQKIEANSYATLVEFSDDFQLMCDNAIKYNHHETVYNKAARKLLQAGMRLFLPEHLIRGPYAVFVRDMTFKELGFDPNLKLEHHDEPYSIDSTEADDTGMSMDHMDPLQEEREKRERMKCELDPKSSFEPFVDPLTADEVLEQVQRAARDARSKLNKRKAHSMGFLRTNSDGTTSMKILVDSEEGVPEKIKKLGEFTGKLEKGTGLLQNFREDRRNTVKLPKALNYGSFSSFAPTFDTRFTNLTVEETDLILSTYGSDDGANYSTSITRFAQDSHYGSTLANKLLDLLTNGEHSKTMETLMEAEDVKQNQIEVDKLLPNYQKEAKHLEGVAIDFDELKTLKDIGVDTNFLNVFERVIKNGEFVGDAQSKLDNTSNLIEQLNQVQHDRLSAPLPQHLSLIAHPNKQEVELADQITSNITSIAKKLPPGAITSVVGVRKAIGMNIANFPPESNLRLTKFATNSRPIDVDATEVDMEIEPPPSSEFDHEIRKLLGTE